MANLRLTDVHKRFGSVHAVRGVSLTIADGEFAVLVGPSGCGKSTLLRLVAGLEPFDQGTIEIAGKIVNDVPPKRRDIAMVFQNYALYPYMTVFENLAFPLRIGKVPDAELRARVSATAEMLAIGGLLDRYPRQLSGGQRQRVAMGRAIVRKPSLFLFDEPLSNLDAQLRDDMRIEIKRLHRELRTTIVYVTHDQVEAMTLADRIVLLRDGVVEQEGKPLDVYRRPATRFVARFLGSPPMGFATARLERDAARLSLVVDGLQPWPLPTALSTHGSGTVVVGIRPDHFGPWREGAEADGVVRLPITVDLVEPTGARTYVSFTIGKASMLAELPAGAAVAPGARIDLSLDLRRVTLFDPGTERAL
jgi:multiple sugar transport system ATP-binding protein